MSPPRLTIDAALGAFTSCSRAHFSQTQEEDLRRGRKTHFLKTASMSFSFFEKVPNCLEHPETERAEVAGCRCVWGGAGTSGSSGRPCPPSAMVVGPSEGGGRKLETTILRMWSECEEGSSQDSPPLEQLSTRENKSIEKHSRLLLWAKTSRLWKVWRLWLMQRSGGFGTEWLI